MTAPAPPPLIFAPDRRRAARRRASQAQHGTGAARFLHGEAADDVLERLAFLRHPVRRALVIGDLSGLLARDLAAQGATVVTLGAEHDDEVPLDLEPFDLVASLFRLDVANDLPGALVHLRAALAPGGLMLAYLVGAGSLPALRSAMQAADGERPAPRLHPQVDVRAGGQLLQRAGLAEPVASTTTLEVRYSRLDPLVDDLRAMGLANQLARPGPPLTRAQLDRARAAFAAQGDTDGRVTERFEILSLSGRRPA